MHLLLCLSFLSYVCSYLFSIYTAILIIKYKHRSHKNEILVDEYLLIYSFSYLLIYLVKKIISPRK